METTALFSELPMCEPVMMAVQTGLRQVFGADFHIKRLAVRSSAAGREHLVDNNKKNLVLLSNFIF